MAKISFSYENKEMIGEPNIEYTYNLVNPACLNPEELFKHFLGFAQGLGIFYNFGDSNEDTDGNIPFRRNLN